MAQITAVLPYTHLPSDEGLHYHFLNLRKVLECLGSDDGALLDDIATAEEMLKNRLIRSS